MGCNDDTGISFPDWRKLAAAYEIETMTIETQVGLSDKIRNIIEYDGPVLCELLMDQDQPNIPKMAPKTNEHGEFVSQLFEDLYPFLSSEELADNMYKNWEYNQSTN
jgi:acetolactate synthase-1/2/3 large subunit